MMYEYVHPNSQQTIMLVEYIEKVSEKRTRVRHLTKAGWWRYIKVSTEHLRPASPPSNEYLELFK